MTSLATLTTALAVALLAWTETLQARNQESIQDCPECPRLVIVPAGTFERADHADPWLRGDAGRGPSHTVTIPEAFAIGRFEVTVGQWRTCVEDGGCSHDPDPGPAAGDDHPVVGVSWHDARVYVRWLSERTGRAYRLPTESEWEYAARAGTDARFFGWDEPDSLCAVANLAGSETDLEWASDRCADAYPGTAPVGSFRPNGFGLHDVAGNVWEWVQDCYHDAEWESRGEWTTAYPPGAPRDGSAFVGTPAQCRSRIMRGGSWRNGGTHVFSPRFRNFDYAERRYPNLGFRVARGL